MNTLDSLSLLALGVKVFLILLAAFVIVILLSKGKKIKTEINDIVSEEKNEEKEQILAELERRGVEVPVPDQELYAQSRIELNIAHPHLTEFIRIAKAVDLTDKDIKDELVKAGWPDEEVDRALNS